MFRARGWLLLCLLGLAAACTRANPAYRITAGDLDAGEDEEPPPGARADAAVPRADGRPPGADAAAFAEPDAAALADLRPPDLPPFNPPLDAAPPADLRPPADLARDLGIGAWVAGSHLVAYWRFDDVGGTSVPDSSSYNNHGIARNGAVLQSGGFPGAKFPNAGSLRLDGQDDYVDVTTKTMPGAGQPKSMTAWFRATNPKGIPIRNLLALTNGSNSGIQLGLDQGRVSAWFYNDLAPRVWSTTEVDGNWHHAAYTFDGTTHRIYYDGGMAMGKAISPPSGNTTVTRIGTWQAPDELFHGVIDDVRVYSRALSDAEVLALFRGEQ